MERTGNHQGRQSEEALSLLSHQNRERHAVHELQHRNLLFLLCRILPAAPGYRLRPSELAVETVGDLSCLSQESRMMLLNRMEREVPSRTAKGDTWPATPFRPCPDRSER